MRRAVISQWGVTDGDGQHDIMHSVLLLFFFDVWLSFFCIIVFDIHLIFSHLRPQEATYRQVLHGHVGCRDLESSP